jgi:hypothetical protein
MRPAYQIFVIDLSQLGAGANGVGRQVIQSRANLFRFIDCKDANGAFSADGFVQVQLGLESADLIPLRINGKISAETNTYVITWTPGAQLFASFMVAENVPGSEVDIEAPPAKQLVTSASSTTLSAAQSTVTTTPTIMANASGTRQSVTVRNLSPTTIYLGGPTVTTGQGLPVAPGDSFTFSGTTAPIYGICASGSAAYAVLSEG